MGTVLWLIVWLGKCFDWCTLKAVIKLCLKKRFIKFYAVCVTWPVSVTCAHRSVFAGMRVDNRSSSERLSATKLTPKHTTPKVKADRPERPSPAATQCVDVSFSSLFLLSFAAVVCARMDRICFQIGVCLFQHLFISQEEHSKIVNKADDIRWKGWDPNMWLTCLNKE